MKDRIMVFIAVIVVIAMAGCYPMLKRIPRSEEPWEISGSIISDRTGMAVPGVPVTVARAESCEWWRLFCMASYKPVFTIHSDSSGKYYVSSHIKANYVIDIGCNDDSGRASNGVPMGTLTNQKIEQDLIYHESPCE